MKAAATHRRNRTGPNGDGSQEPVIIIHPVNRHAWRVFFSVLCGQSSPSLNYEPVGHQPSLLPVTLIILHLINSLSLSQLSVFLSVRSSIIY